MNPAEVVDEIERVFSEKGHRSYGEHVTELQHGLQCATFATQAGENPFVVAACLLHDYGHLLHDLGEDIANQGVDARHERIGANRLQDWFPAEVVEPIRLHAASKRYLCWKEAAYFDGLSEASRDGDHCLLWIEATAVLTSCRSMDTVVCHLVPRIPSQEISMGGRLLFGGHSA
jgi:predicted HD phosphohydrolase